jgi:hypothetical protein
MPYPKYYLQRVNIFHDYWKRKISNTTEMIFYTNDLNLLEEYLNEKCKKHNKYYEFWNAHFRDLQSLKIEDTDLNFYWIDFTRNINRFEQQENFSVLINDKRIDNLISKDFKI